MNTFNKTFQIDYFSEIEDRRYTGTFTTKKLTIGDLSKLGLRKTQLSGGYSFDEETGKGVDSSTFMLNEMVAHCEVALIQKPEWFIPEDLVDIGLLRKVYEEVASFEANFYTRSVQGVQQGDGVRSSSPSTSSVESEGGGGSLDSFETLVDRKVPKITPV